ncbi:MAG TPA: hypothetical protein VER33_11660 [Polyangiaceae bacterium]|nr:hypothetical protein [Polyangiaceae bacterium]
MRSYRDELLSVTEQLATQSAELEALNRTLQELQAEGRVSLPSRVLADLEQVFDGAGAAPVRSTAAIPCGLRV